MDALGTGQPQAGEKKAIGPIKVGDKFQGYWSAVKSKETSWFVIDVIKPTEVVIRDRNRLEDYIVITRRENNIWREKGHKKEHSGHREIGYRWWPCDNPRERDDPDFT